MQLSILIPTYNYDLTSLATQLSREADELGLSYEILLGDDASSESYRQLYAELSTALPALVHISLPENIGVNRMRNLLINKAKSDWCLLLDSDVLPARGGFIAKYLPLMNDKSVDIYVGRINYSPPPQRSWALRYAYGQRYEVMPFAALHRAPRRRFISMNLLVRRSMALRVPCPEDVGMGYEDALWGQRLNLAGAQIATADVVVFHQIKEDNKAFLSTLDGYLQNLALYSYRFPTGAVRLLDFWRGSCGSLSRRLLSIVSPILLPLIGWLLERYPRLFIRLMPLYKLLRFALYQKRRG